MSAPISLAFAAGMVAAFNPCGFALLPAYLGAFIAGDRANRPTGHLMLRAVSVASAVSIGFVAVFSGAGLIIDQLTASTRERLPWVTILIGALLVIVGIAMTGGWKPILTPRGPDLTAGRRGTAAMVGYGATFAVASLSCTIGPFLAVTGAALTRSTIEGIATYTAYALGMGTIILVISVATALAHDALVSTMRSLTRITSRLGGILMVTAGGYAIWYGRWELEVYGGDLGNDRIVDTVEDVRLGIVETVQSIGAGRIALAVAIGTTITILAAQSPRTRDRTGPTSPEGT